jgi:integrase
LLALATGLRRGDIESLKVADIDFEKNCITTTSRKTRKSMGARPVPTVIIEELKKYLNHSRSEHYRLFDDNFNYKRWKKICKKEGLFDLKFHDLRKTFGPTLAQHGVSTAVTQRLLEHSSPILTNKVYTNIDPVLRQSVERLPIQNWL